MMDDLSDNEHRRKALLDQMGGEPENTGISGYGRPGGLEVPGIQTDTPATPAIPAALPAADPTTPAAPDYSRLGQFAGKLRGYDMGKFQRPQDQWSEKYKIGAVQSHFDPLKGVTPEFLAALKAQGIGGADFSGEGDKLNVINRGGYDRFGSGGTADVITGLKGQNADTAWNPWLIEEQAAQGGGGGQAQPLGPMLNAGGGDLDPQLGGDPLTKIKEALARMSGQRPNMEALMAQLGGGQ